MNPGTRRILPILLSATTAVVAVHLPAQSPGSLPPWQCDTVARSLAERRLADALRAGLNSPGDTMALHAEGELSVALVAVVNGGTRQGIAAEVRRTEDGFEVAVDQQVALTVGIEAYDGLELNAVGAAGQQVLFAWDTPDEAARGLRLLSGAHELAVGSLQGMLRSQLEMVRQSAEALREAVTRTRAARAVHDGLARTHEAADRELRRLQREASRVRGQLHRIRGALSRAERKVRRLPRWLRGAASKAVRSLRRSLSRHGALYRAIDASLRAAERTAAGARAAADDARSVLDHLVRQEDAARKVHDAAVATADHARDFADSIGVTVGELTHHLCGVEYTVRGGAEASAAVHPAGISLENVGMGAGASTFLGARIGYRIRASGEELTVVGFHDLSMEAWAGFGVGARTEFGATTGIEACWSRPRGASHYAFDDLETTFEVDASLLAVVGAGVAFRHGIGRTETLSLNAAQWQRAYRSLTRLGGDLSVDNLSRALHGIPCTFTVSERWIAQVIAAAGGSYAGYGLGAELGATWDDAGAPLERETDAGEMLRMMLSSAARTQTAHALGARL